MTPIKLLFILLLDFVDGLQLSFVDYPNGIVYKNKNYDVTWKSDLPLKYIQIDLLHTYYDTLYSTERDERYYSLSFDRMDGLYKLLLKVRSVNNSSDEIIGPDFTIVSDPPSSSIKLWITLLIVFGSICGLVLLSYCCCYSFYQEPPNNRVQPPNIYVESRNEVLSNLHVESPDFKLDSPPSYRSDN